MTGVPTSDLKTYFAEARSWDDDRWSAADRSRRLAWIVASIAAGVATVAVLAVAALAPLKTVEPFVVRVDRTTGAVDVMTGLKPGAQLGYDEVVTKYFLATYVRARETWLPAAAEANFRQVSIMSTIDEQQRWAEAFRPANPQSPEATLGAAGQALVEIRAITFVSPKVANVRFHKFERHGQQLTESDWISTVAFAYARAPMLEADRLRNPLGFQVATYRADPEVVR